MKDQALGRRRRKHAPALRSRRRRRLDRGSKRERVFVRLVVVIKSRLLVGSNRAVRARDDALPTRRRERHRIRRRRV